MKVSYKNNLLPKKKKASTNGKLSILTNVSSINRWHRLDSNIRGHQSSPIIMYNSSINQSITWQGINQPKKQKWTEFLFYSLNNNHPRNEKLFSFFWLKNEWNIHYSSIILVTLLLHLRSSTYYADNQRIIIIIIIIDVFKVFRSVNSAWLVGWLMSMIFSSSFCRLIFLLLLLEFHSNLKFKFFFS